MVIQAHVVNEIDINFLRLDNKVFVSNPCMKLMVWLKLFFDGLCQQIALTYIQACRVQSYDRAGSRYFAQYVLYIL